MINKFAFKIARRIALVIIVFMKYSSFDLAMKLRNLCYSFVLKEMGENCNICDGVTIKRPENLSLGKRVSIHPYTIIKAMGEISIGDNSGVSTGCALLGVAHNYKDPSVPYKEQRIIDQPIAIGKDVQIGVNVTLLGDAIIGDGSMICAGSVVSGNIPSYSIVVGNPGRVVLNRKVRFNSEKEKSPKPE